MKDKKSTDYLITLNVTTLLIYVFVFSFQTNIFYMKALVLASLGMFILSLILLVWYRLRMPIRHAYYKELKDKSVNHTTDALMSFATEIVGPLAAAEARIEVRDKVEKAKNKTELIELQKSIEDGTFISESRDIGKLPAVRTIVESFVKNFTYDTNMDYKKAFKSPLKEKHAKKKFVLDVIAMKIRVHVLIMGAVLLMGAIVLKVLTN